ncbi:hypothetical protein HBB16_01395 [Pseudonocardia sp. MCCB 268]|nr:hypothetical protein [Pseudonocardia cytotoxica]
MQARLGSARQGEDSDLSPDRLTTSCWSRVSVLHGSSVETSMSTGRGGNGLAGSPPHPGEGTSPPTTAASTADVPRARPVVPRELG